MNIDIIIIIAILDDAVANNRTVWFTIGDDVFKVYCNISGQRAAFLSHYIYENEKGETDYTVKPEKYYHNGTYQLRRRLTFKEDEGKENAILGVLSLKDKTFKIKSVTETDDRIDIRLDDIYLTILKNRV